MVVIQIHQILFQTHLFFFLLSLHTDHNSEDHSKQNHTNNHCRIGSGFAS